MIKKDNRNYESPSGGKKILFLVPHPVKRSPSQRFRFEQYFQILRKNSFTFTVSPFLGGQHVQLFSADGKHLQKFASLAGGLVRRAGDILRAPYYDFIFIHREASPIGPPLFEWILKFVLRKRIIYDFDDAIWLTDKANESAFEKSIKWRSKVESICRWSFKVSCANAYLLNYAIALNRQVVLLPTTLDMDTVHNPNLHRIKKSNASITIGWTGSHSTLKYLKVVETVIAEIQAEHPNVTFLVIADRKPSLSIPSLCFVKWNAETEIQDLLEIDIGIMPLPDNDWTKGKSGLKCLQYLALRIPAVASDVGVNSQIIEHGINGFLARNQQEWKHYLLMLVNDQRLRESLAAEGQKKIIQNYSVASNKAAFLSLFQ